VVPRDAHAALFRAIERDPTAIVTVDLETQTLVLPDGSSVQFPIDGFSKQCMLYGVDELGYILHRDPLIAAYESRRVLSVNTLG
jgi:3-isopropylmalate/(R)-2-methylmalate dehydratase small subunit